MEHSEVLNIFVTINYFIKLLLINIEKGQKNPTKKRKEGLLGTLFLLKLTLKETLNLPKVLIINKFKSILIFAQHLFKKCFIK